MGTSVFMGNLPLDTQEEQVKDLCKDYGEVKSVKMIFDKVTGNFRGFCFVEMSTQEESQKLIEELNDKDFNGRPMKVDQARERQNRGGGHRGGGGGYQNRQKRW